MKSGTLAVVIAGLVTIGGITYSFIRNGESSLAEQPAVSTASQESSDLVHVDDLADKPDKFTGEVVLRAVVAGVKKSEGVIGVIDSREFESCGVLNCAKNYLPVKFSGTLPEPKTVLEIRGQVVRTENGLVFNANQVDPVR